MAIPPNFHFIISPLFVLPRPLNAIIWEYNRTMKPQSPPPALRILPWVCIHIDRFTPKEARRRRRPNRQGFPSPEVMRNEDSSSSGASKLSMKKKRPRRGWGKYYPAPRNSPTHPPNASPYHTLSQKYQPSWQKCHHHHGAEVPPPSSVRGGGEADSVRGQVVRVDRYTDEEQW